MEELKDLFSSLVPYIALVVSILSAVYAKTQAATMEKDRMTSVMLDMLKEFRSEPMLRKRIFIKNHLREKWPNDGKGLRSLSEDDLVAVQSVSHFLDNLGLFLGYKLVSEKIITTFIGDEIEILWKEL